MERQWIADNLARVVQTDGLNLERCADIEQARKTLNRVHVQLRITLEREQVLREDGVIEEFREDLCDRNGVTASETGREIAAGPNTNNDVECLIAFEREDNLSSPFFDEAARQNYFDVVERELGDAQPAELRNGVADVFKTQIEDRLDRLYAAKA